jgi:leucyl aminopeptidase (aminopeptidase T)
MSSLYESAGFAMGAGGDRSSASLAASLAEAAKIAVSSSLKLKEGESLLIVTNPEREVLEIAAALYDAAAALGARASLIVQPVKTQTDYAEDSVIAAFDSRPDAFVSLSAEKLGKDREGIRTPYEWDGASFDHVFHYQLRGAKTLRAFWSPGLTREMFAKAANIDYAELKARCQAISKALAGASYVRVTNEKGTDIRVGVKGRLPKSDDGDFSEPGSGGNLPAGETFISPELDASEGIIVFDGSIAAVKGDIVIRRPIRARVEGGFVVDVSGGEEAAALRASLESGEEAARKLAAEGAIGAEKAAAYVRNARNLGELGIGLNPKAEIVGNMLEDEKAFRTCHFAIGSNYDEDAPALIHLDGLVTRPTIVAVDERGRETAIEREGELLL